MTHGLQPVESFWFELVRLCCNLVSGMIRFLLVFLSVIVFWHTMKSPEGSGGASSSMSIGLGAAAASVGMRKLPSVADCADFGREKSSNKSSRLCKDESALNTALQTSSQASVLLDTTEDIMKTQGLLQPDDRSCQLCGAKDSVIDPCFAHLTIFGGYPPKFK